MIGQVTYVIRSIRSVACAIAPSTLQAYAGVALLLQPREVVVAHHREVEPRVLGVRRVAHELASGPDCSVIRV